MSDTENDYPWRYDPIPRRDAQLPPREPEATRIEELERDLKSVLDRESATTARYDSRIEELERERDARENGWLIHKRNRGWYRPNAQGYTANPAEAGRYSHKEAFAYSHPNGLDGPRDGMKIVHESELPPSPLDLAAELADLRAEVERLRLDSERLQTINDELTRIAQLFAYCEDSGTRAKMREELGVLPRAVKGDGT